jgi:methylated-DNA-[protein]-cysteine S-methyltransferase
MTLYRALVRTPVGPLRLLASDTALCACEFSIAGRMARLDARLERWFEKPEVTDAENRIITDARAWLERYFSGESADTSGLPLDLRGAPFERRVWDSLRQIPPGTTTSYGAIAKQVDAPGAARAVGMANGANPIAIIVPCHRVIGASGKLTGYGGGLDRKTWLLNHEKRWSPGLPFDQPSSD